MLPNDDNDSMTALEENIIIADLEDLRCPICESPYIEVQLWSTSKTETKDLLFSNSKFLTNIQTCRLGCGHKFCRFCINYLKGECMLCESKITDISKCPEVDTILVLKYNKLPIQMRLDRARAISKRKEEEETFLTQETLGNQEEILEDKMSQTSMHLNHAVEHPFICPCCLNNNPFEETCEDSDEQLPELSQLEYPTEMQEDEEPHSDLDGDPESQIVEEEDEDDGYDFVSQDSDTARSADSQYFEGNTLQQETEVEEEEEPPQPATVIYRKRIVEETYSASQNVDTEPIPNQLIFPIDPHETVTTTTTTTTTTRNNTHRIISTITYAYQNSGVDWTASDTTTTNSNRRNAFQQTYPTNYFYSPGDFTPQYYQYHHPYCHNNQDSSDQESTCTVQSTEDQNGVCVCTTCGCGIAQCDHTDNKETEAGEENEEYFYPSDHYDEEDDDMEEINSARSFVHTAPQMEELVHNQDCQWSYHTENRPATWAGIEDDYEYECDVTNEEDMITDDEQGVGDTLQSSQFYDNGEQEEIGECGLLS